MDYSAWGVSWLGAWGNSWGPLHEVEEGLTPGGHWKHLFKPVRGATSPVVTLRGMVSCRVISPVTIVKIRIAAESQYIPRATCRIRLIINAPITGVCTPILVRRCPVKVRIARPRCAAVVPTGRGRLVTFSRRVWPEGGAVVPETTGPAETGSVVLRPRCVRNPTIEMLVML